MVDRVHGYGVRGLLRRMMERNEPGLMAGAPRRIDRAGARRLMVAAEGEAGMTGADADAGSGRILAKNAPSRAALVIYGAVIAGFMGTSLKGPQHAWSASGLLGSPPDSGAGDKESMMISKMSAVGVVSMMIASQAGAADAVQWRVEDGGNGHWYLGVVADGCTWTGARTAALNVGGDLVSLGTQTESDWVYAQIASKATLWRNRVGPRIGLVQDASGAEPSGGWSWSDGTPLAYTNWNVDGFLGQPNPIDVGVCVDSDFGGYYGWPNMPMNSWGSYQDTFVSACHWENFRSYIIEWSADCNHDNIVDYGEILSGQLSDASGNGIPDVCETPLTCHNADLYPNGRIDGADLAALLSEWGPVNRPTRSDFNLDGLVNGSDLAFLLANWGPCPQ